MITGGDWTSTVPARCTLSCRLAMYPGVVAARDAATGGGDGGRGRAWPSVPARANPPRVRYDGFVCEGATVRSTSRSWARWRVPTPTCTAPPALRPTTATTDARHFLRHGIPTVCFGPRGEDYHGVDERVSLSSMHTCAEMLARFMLEWCGVPE